MAEIKLTKTELRQQQVKLGQLQKYLPTLQLKKALLQIEINQVDLQLERLEEEFLHQERRITGYAPLLSMSGVEHLFSQISVAHLHKRYENVAGVDVPHFERVEFEPLFYSLFDAPLWFDEAHHQVKQFIAMREEIRVAYEKKRLLGKELREVSIRVNLFEKNLIPRTLGYIKKIKIFLGDQQLAAIAQAKASKRKIQERKKVLLHDHFA